MFRAVWIIRCSCVYSVNATFISLWLRMLLSFVVIEHMAIILWVLVKPIYNISMYIQVSYSKIQNSSYDFFYNYILLWNMKLYPSKKRPLNGIGIGSMRSVERLRQWYLLTTGPRAASVGTFSARLGKGDRGGWWGNCLIALRLVPVYFFKVYIFFWNRRGVN